MMKWEDIGTLNCFASIQCEAKKWMTLDLKVFLHRWWTRCVVSIRLTWRSGEKVSDSLERIESIALDWTCWNGSKLLDKLNPLEWIDSIEMGWQFYILLRIGGQKDWIAQVCTQLYVIRKHENIYIGFSIQNYTIRIKLIIDQERGWYILVWCLEYGQQIYCFWNF